MPTDRPGCSLGRGVFFLPTHRPGLFGNLRRLKHGISACISDGAARNCNFGKLAEQDLESTKGYSTGAAKKNHLARKKRLTYVVARIA